MTCKYAKKIQAEVENLMNENNKSETKEIAGEKAAEKLFFESIQIYSLTIFFKIILPNLSGSKKQGIPQLLGKKSCR